MTHDRDAAVRSGQTRVELQSSPQLPFWERVTYWPKPWGGGLYACDVEVISS